MSKDLNAQLRAADPMAGEPGLSSEERAAIRRATLAALDSAPARPAWWTMPVVAAGVALFIVIAALISPLAIRRSSNPQSAAALETAPLPSTHEQRQIQFETPGGTRIIWVLNPDADF